ncbi:MAG: reverse transcriptase-like protein, partial [Firmicutes bacterium]|nr:reverse transcriptase-like protein [Bacillota bacterium]
MKLILHIDGASRGNPGPAGIGVVIADVSGTVLAEVSEYIGEVTNNVAEYKALLKGLQEAARIGAKDVSIYSDSELLVKQMNGQYRVRHP